MAPEQATKQAAVAPVGDLAAAAADAETETEVAPEVEVPMATLEEVVAKHVHIKAYLARLEEQGKPVPEWHPTASRDLKEKHPYNFLYPVGDPIFIHVHEEEGELFPRYTSIQPTLKTDEDRAIMAALADRAFVDAPSVEVPDEEITHDNVLDELLGSLEGVVTIDVDMDAGKIVEGGRRGNNDGDADGDDEDSDGRDRGTRKAVKKPRKNMKKLTVQGDDLARYRFLLHRDLAEHGIVEPIMKDPWIEDVHCIGTKPLYPVHKIFGMVQSNIQFPDTYSLDAWLETMGERMGRPVSNANPIVDGALPDGSRINIVYGEEVSKGGSSWTVRKFSDVPIPVTQLVAWGSFDAHIAAYLWLCLENGMSVFVAGETASGKTTTTNGILPFIPPASKIMTAEDTPEVLPPHRNWQQLITRDRGGSDASVTMYDLLKAGLRSRPDCIIVGEIRGAEGAVAFQAMQTGHPTMATFHASSVGKLIQRFTSDPINVPLAFMPNLNVVLIQMAVYVHGKMLRRVLAVEEIEGFDKRSNSAITRQVFTWDSVTDKFRFGGKNNSFVLETMVAPKLGLADPRHIYRMLDKRVWIIEELIRREMFDYHTVQKLLFRYSTEGDSVLPFEVPEEHKPW